MIEQTYLDILLGDDRCGLLAEVKIAVYCAFAYACLERKLVNALGAVLANIATHCIRAHPGWAGYMIAAETLPDALCHINGNSTGNPFQVLVRHVINCKGIPDATHPVP